MDVLTPVTPAEWLPILLKRLDERHVARPAPIGRLRRYAHGEADLPEMGRNLRASWEAFQKKARTDFGGIAVRSLKNRIRPNGLRVGTSDDNPALVAARRIWVKNRLEVEIPEAIRDYLEVGVGYLTVELSVDGEALVAHQPPERFIAIPDPVTPWRPRAALKVWRDDVTNHDYARVVTSSHSQDFVRSSRGVGGELVWVADGGNWTPIGDPVEFSGSPGVAILDRGSDGPFLAPHLDVIDRINLGKLQRLVTTAMQAFRQRALKPKGDAGGLPDKDADGNDINWAAAFEPAPGALWELPEGIDIWESQYTDIGPMLNGEKQDARDFAAATGTPISALIPEGENQSAEGAANAKEQQIAQARDDIARITPAIEGAMKDALEVVGVELGDERIEVLFAPPEHVSVSEKYAAAVQAKAAGLSARTIKRDILGMTPDQIAQDEADAGADMLAAALLGITGASGGADTSAA